MRLLFDLICLALAGVVAHAEPPALPGGRLKSPTTRHLRVHEPAHSTEEERGSVQIAEWFVRAVSKRGHEDASEHQLNAEQLEMVLDEPSTSYHRKVLESYQEKNQDLDRTILDRLEQDMNVIVASKAPLLGTLTELYGVKGVDTIIRVAQKIRGTRPIAQLLQRLRGMTNPDDILAEIKSEESITGTFFRNKKMFDWIKYVDYFNEEYPAKAKTMRERLGHSDMELVDMLYSELDQPRDLRSGNRMLNKLVKSWLNAGYSPIDIFNLLGLHSSVIEFNSTRFGEWMHYLTDFNAKWKTDVSYYSELVKMYEKDKLIIMLKVAPKKSRIKRLALDIEREFKEKLKDAVKNAAKDAVKAAAKDYRNLHKFASRIRGAAEPPKTPRNLLL